MAYFNENQPLGPQGPGASDQKVLGFGFSVGLMQLFHTTSVWGPVDPAWCTIGPMDYFGFSVIFLQKNVTTLTTVRKAIFIRRKLKGPAC